MSERINALLCEERARWFAICIYDIFMGAESDINHLRRVIDVMCDLAEAIENVAWTKPTTHPNPGQPRQTDGYTVVESLIIKASEPKEKGGAWKEVNSILTIVTAHAV